jgi:hypothetical protein
VAFSSSAEHADKVIAAIRETNPITIFLLFIIYPSSLFLHTDSINGKYAEYVEKVTNTSGVY